jgi:hypothetical protein
MTTRNERTTQSSPIAGTTLTNGAASAPANPASAEPSAKESAFILAVSTPSAAAMAGLMIVARARKPKSVRRKTNTTAVIVTIARIAAKIWYVG